MYGEALAERRGDQRQSEPPAVGRVQCRHPAQQGREPGRHCQTASLGARFHPGIAIPVAEAFAHHMLATARQRGQDDRDPVRLQRRVSTVPGSTGSA